jgi:hypothetical protein
MPAQILGETAEVGQMPVPRGHEECAHGKPAQEQKQAFAANGDRIDSACHHSPPPVGARPVPATLRAGDFVQHSPRG